MDGNPSGTGIGQPVRRREDRRLLTGKGRYSDDVNLPGQAYAVMVRSPHAHALIRSVDTAAARAMPGVLAVLTADDVSADGLQPLPNIANAHPADISIQNKDGAPIVRPHQAAIIGPEVCHVGEIVAAVIGASVAAAKDAAERVAVDYQVLPSVCHSLIAAEPDAPQARQDSPNIILDGEVGDPAATEAAFARAAHVVRLDTWVQRIAGVPMEPRAAVGEFDPKSGHYTLHAGAGGAVSPRRDLAMVLDVPTVPAVHFRARAALTNTVPTRPYRSSGRPEVMFVMERLVDLAARQTGIDRIELRRRNLVPETMMPYTNPFGMVYDSGAYHQVMERVLEIADWAGFPARRKAARRHGKYRGIGVANYVDTATGAPREKAEVTVKPEGRVGGTVEVVIGTTSQGQGHETSFAQLITEWLGVPIDTVKLVTGDTDRVSVGGGAHSGRALRLGSIVMFNSSNQIIEKGLKIASHVLEAAVEDIAFAEGRFEVKGTDRAIGIFEVARAALDRSDLPEALRGPLQGISDETVNLAAFPYGCHVCEVEIDPDTGEAEIVRYSAVDDCGRAVNPMIVHGQVHGGIVQGVGQALWEQCVYEAGTAQVLSGSFMDYAMPKADMVPFFDTELSEVPSPTHPLGIRPAGEGGTTPALAVVINAVVDALSECGVAHIEMPATPERVWRAINGISNDTPRQQ